MIVDDLLEAAAAITASARNSRHELRYQRDLTTGDPSKIVLEADDIVLAEIIARLRFDKYQ